MVRIKKVLSCEQEGAAVGSRSVINPTIKNFDWKVALNPTTQQIRALREVGLSLPNIRRILIKPHDAKEKLKARRRELLGKVEALESKLNVLNEVFAA
jgi:hypothetical protein